MNSLGDDRTGRALALAIEVHKDQTRKGTDIPYMAHILGVAALVVEGGGDEDAVIAALLHDTVEDGGDPGVIREVIKAEFGADVLTIVDALSDAAPEAGQDKGPWRERKATYIEHVRESSDARTQLVCLADKLHNLNATLNDLDEHGASTWAKFNAPPADQCWYYESLGEVFATGPVAGNPLEVAYRGALARLRAHPDA